jgi:hypothetical protein
MTDHNPAQIVPEQVDREAAIDLAVETDDFYDSIWVNDVRVGRLDEWPTVQAFARHRLLGRDEGLRRAAEIAREDRRTDAAKEYGHEPEFHLTGKRIASAILAEADQQP